MLKLQIDTDKLCSTLAEVETVQLKGLTLLQSQEHFMGLLPKPADMPRDILRDAVLELIAYTDACAHAIQRLRDVPPVPMNIPIVEWVL